MNIGSRIDDLWKVVVILLGLAVWNSGPGDLETAQACSATASEDDAASEHSENMLAACRRELVQAHELAEEAAGLVKLADFNFGLLMQRCVPIPPRSPFQKAMGRDR